MRRYSDETYLRYVMNPRVEYEMLTPYKQYFAEVWPEEQRALTMGEMQVMLFLANNPGCDTARDMVVVRGLGKSQVSQAVELLVGKGFLERSPSRRDRNARGAAIPAGSRDSDSSREPRRSCPWRSRQTRGRSRV